MIKVYAKILIEELTEAIVEKALVDNIYTARRTQDGQYVLLSFDSTKVPLELFKLGYSLWDINQAKSELQNAEWAKEETLPQHLRITSQPTTVILENNKSMSTNFNSNPMDVSRSVAGFIAATWSGIDGTNSTMILEGSNDGVNWGELGGEDGGIVIQSLDDDTQIWEFTSFTTKLIRLAYKANNVTTGNVTIIGHKRSNTG